MLGRPSVVRFYFLLTLTDVQCTFLLILSEFLVKKIEKIFFQFPTTASGPPRLAAARSRRGSDSPPDCHSLPRRHFATLKVKSCKNSSWIINPTLYKTAKCTTKPFGIYAQCTAPLSNSNIIYINSYYVFTFLEKFVRIFLYFTLR